ncbi:dienelactone hydrolase family protein (plasmid) [Streptomyces sp. NBC_00441]|nr:dienelactone hydrolase family protein [Streptomyces sp. NBC_00441]
MQNDDGSPAHISARLDTWCEHVLSAAVRDGFVIGINLVERIGWAAVVKHARQALGGMPDETVLAGVSMGASVVADLWPERPATAGVLLLHAAVDLPVSVRPGLRVQLHAAEPDDFAPPERVAALCQAAREAGVDVEVFRYPGVGHFYIDGELPDHDLAAAELTWRRVLDSLNPSGSNSKVQVIAIR